jgi:hypothetical protein
MNKLDPSKIIVLSMHNDKFSELADITLPNKIEYCNRWGYSIYNDDFGTIISKDNKVGYRTYDENLKLNILKKTIECQKYEWMMWIDCDAFVTNHTISIESLIDDDYDFIIGEDWNGINAGVFLLRCNESTKRFIQNCIDYIPTEYDKTQTPFWWWPSEQCSFTRLLNTIRTKFVSNTLFNSYLIGPRPDNIWSHMNIGPSKPYQDIRFELGNFILHLVGDYIENKIMNAKLFGEMVIK